MAEKRVRILVSNDDGIMGEGMLALVRVFGVEHADRYDVKVSCPAEEQSAKGHSITLYSLLEAERYVLPEPLADIEAYKVFGSPVDSVKCCMLGSFFGEEWQPDVILSGINKGANTGVNVLYSGTVGAAREGTINGIPAIALSLHFDQTNKHHLHFADAAKALVTFVDWYCVSLQNVAFRKAFENITVNVNVPNRPGDTYKGWRLTNQGLSKFNDRYVIEKDNKNMLERKGSFTALLKNGPDLKNHTTFHIIGTMVVTDESIDFDTKATHEGYISITAIPLIPSVDDRSAKEEIQKFLSTQ
mmetsp:Transcript_3615/g.9870  ORF Transcript_3615/g.9870 Transcript_3615/m.9870 type:complete len:301 (+) Transcript_3615:81-983(+)|eukprot:CAMPEP_0119138916 /NCGR_PEP_ID=MMETSP1310-20130426/26565_1 /TAXON_ID=464262 /ORGANISM="Genus nov. species nov., Strain RCC2339" /LENGTH=300 /DNA_ID=CAMNT_0007130159 /DNA_START=79 /DNA_END=981 /DNA_ORIENTATION=-